MPDPSHLGQRDGSGRELQACNSVYDPVLTGCEAEYATCWGCWSSQSTAGRCPHCLEPTEEGAPFEPQEEMCDLSQETVVNHKTTQEIWSAKPRIPSPRPRTTSKWQMPVARKLAFD